jgi:hypothetical protein
MLQYIITEQLLASIDGRTSDNQEAIPDGIHVAQDRIKWRAVVKMAMKFRCPEMRRKFLTS